MSNIKENNTFTPGTDYTVQTEGLNEHNIARFGLNVLYGVTPEIQDAAGNYLKPMWGGNIAAVVQCDYLQHIDIWGTVPVTVSYDMGQNISAEQVVVASMYSPGLDYGTSEYELYFSDNRKDLYKPENRVIYFDNTGIWKREAPLTGAAQVYEFTKKPEGRYFGIRVLKSNTVDPVIRIGRLAVYNAEYTKQHSYIKKFGINVLEAASLKTYDGNDDMFWPQYGYFEMLTDGMAAQKTSVVELCPHKYPAHFIYKLDTAVSPDTLVLVGKSDYFPKVKFYLSNRESALFDSEITPISVESEEILNDGTMAEIFRFKPVDDVRFLAVLLSSDKEKIQVEEIGLFGTSRSVSVDDSVVVNPEFYGIGVNLVPFTLQPGNIKAGYTDAHWCLDSKRIEAFNAKIVRVWVQVDWMEKQKGCYDFDTPEMQGLYRYFEAFKRAGTEIQLTYSWKVGPEIQEWFSIPGIADPYESAPADIDAYARSCSALLQNLWSRGFDNVKHITIANEPNLGDFKCFGDPRAYYVKVIKAIDRQFKADGIRDKINIWASESVTDYTWLRYLEEEVGDCIDINSMHEYGYRSEDIPDMMHKIKAVSEKPYILSEFAEGSFTLNAWNKGYAGHVINGANNGMSSLLNWTLCGVKSMSPSESDSWELGGYGDLWRALLSGGKPQKSYYIMSLLTRYIPADSRVIKSSVSHGDLRSAAFVGKNGEVTLLIENNVGKGRELKLKLPEAMNGIKFYKHRYLPEEVVEEDNTVIPPVCGEFVSENGFTDRLEDGYSVTVYTSIKPLTQVVMENVWVTVDKGETVHLNASVIDNADGVEWSVAVGDGTVENDGTFTASGKSGSYTAVKATSLANPDSYGITLVHVR